MEMAQYQNIIANGLEWYNPKPVMSFNKSQIIIIGQRDVGKTFGWKLYFIKLCLKHNCEMTYTRRFKTDIKEAKTKFITDLTQDEWFAKQDFKITLIGNELYIDGRLIVHFIWLTKSSSVKSSSFQNVRYNLSDEAVEEDPLRAKMIKNEFMKYCSLMRTIFRKRPYVSVLLMNALTIDNVYFNEWDLEIDPNSRFTIFKHRPDIIIENIDDEVLREQEENSPLGRLFKGTSVEAYSNTNKFVLDDSKDVIKKGFKKENYTNICNFKHNGDLLAFYYEYQGYIWVSDVKSKIETFCLDVRETDWETNFRYKQEVEHHLSRVFNAFRINKIRYTSQHIKNAFIDFVKKYK